MNNKKKQITLNDLARMMQKEFLSVKGEFAKVHERFDDLDGEIKKIRLDFEDLKLRQDQSAYRFEIKDFEKRIRRIEMKVGLRTALT